jgi:hypothetical protein
MTNETEPAHHDIPELSRLLGGEGVLLKICLLRSGRDGGVRKIRPPDRHVGEDGRIFAT